MYRSLFAFLLSLFPVPPQIADRNRILADGRPQGPTTPHPHPARPYDTTNRPAKAVYSRGRGGCGRGDGALVAARPYPPHPLFSLFAMYWSLSLPCWVNPPFVVELMFPIILPKSNRKATLSGCSFAGMLAAGPHPE